MKNTILTGIVLSALATTAGMSCQTPALARDAAAMETVITFSGQRFEAPTMRENSSLIAASITPAAASAIAQSAYGGQVLRVSQGQNEYRVKLQTSSGVIIVRVHADTGQILGVIN